MDDSDDDESERELKMYNLQVENELYCAMAAANAAAAKAARRDKAQLWLQRIATRTLDWGPENARHSAEWSTDRSHLPLEYNLIEKR